MDDIALARVIAIYETKKSLGLDHTKVATISVDLVGKEIRALQGVVEACSEQQVRDLAARYLTMAKNDCREINKYVRILNDMLDAVEKAKRFGQHAAEIAESFVQTNTLVVIALCINVQFTLSFANSLVNEAQHPGPRAPNKDAN